MKKEIFRMDRVTHIEKGVTLLDNFNIHVFKGEIMGLLCLNRHGLENFFEIISQNLPIHYGYIFFNEELVNNYQYSSLKENPVVVIGKDSHLVQDLTVADNIFVLNKAYKEHMVISKSLEKRLKFFTEEINVNINPNQYVNQLTVGEKFIVEMLKAVISGARLIVIREISSFIGNVDLIKIQEMMRYYVKEGISFLYVCNHHEEAFKICDRAALMENGRILKILDRCDFKDENIIPYCLDFTRRSKWNSSSGYASLKEGFLEIKNLTSSNIQSINLKVKRGECIVILDSNSTIIEDFKGIILGQKGFLEGDILLNGQSFKKDKRVRKRIEVIDENPTKSMLFYEMTYMENLCFLLDKKLPQFLMEKRIKRSISMEYGKILGEAMEENHIQNLNAESLYSLIYYRIMIYSSEVVVCINPYSGADMYLRHHITQLMKAMLEREITLIILSFNIADTLSVADRVFIIEEGKIIEEYNFS